MYKVIFNKGLDMKKIIQKVLIILFALASIAEVNAVGGRTTYYQRKRASNKKVVAPESPADIVNKEVASYDQIAEQARKMVEAKGERKAKEKVWSVGRKELTRLMNSKDLDPEKIKLIKDDVETIKKISFGNENPAKEAYKRLVIAIDAINKQANVVDTIEEGRIAIERAPEHMKAEVTEEQVKKVQIAEAEAEEAGMLNRMVNGVKGALAAPGNYLFGEERTKAKTAFEATVGALALGGALYGAYVAAPTVAQAAAGAYAAAKSYFSPAAAPAPTPQAPKTTTSIGQLQEVEETPGK